MTPRVLTELTNGGVSVWLDDLDRSRLDTRAGERSLQHLIDDRSVRGVTTNPTIFDRAVGSGADHYSGQLGDLGRSGTDVDAAITAVTTDDVRAACDVFTPVWERTEGMDGRVSIEVDPRLAHDTEGTIAHARELWERVGRPNAMIKIPATQEGLPAITEVLSLGISVNVTLIFSVDRYREVMAAHVAGLQRAQGAGRPLSGIESVASFFISRVDTAVDSLLSATGSLDHLRGKAAIANAQLAWAAYLAHMESDAWASLSAASARPHRPQWASTGVKDPAFDPTRYVIDLAAPGCVNTMPEATLQAVATSGVFRGDMLTGRADEAAKLFQDLAAAGIDMPEVCRTLESAGVQSFIDSWEGLRATVAAAIAR
ncbi:MAG: transaldolase [Candidatus Nanopelagicales bacterium]